MPTEAIAGSFSTVDGGFLRSTMAGYEMSCAASVMPTINPVSCCGKKPLGMTT